MKITLLSYRQERVDLVRGDDALGSAGIQPAGDVALPDRVHAVLGILLGGGFVEISIS